jgi:pyroglutamyl-peptidase
MTCTILLTGFGPFPGAPVNPTGPLVTALARPGRPDFRNVRRIAHVFQTSYQAVDRELPALVARVRPDALVMFGLASRIRHIRVETRARNALSSAMPDASGRLPGASIIVPGAPPALALRAPAQRLVAAARAAGMRAALSGDAGSYLCNYLCWRASEAAGRAGGPRLVAFVHVPKVRLRSLHARVLHGAGAPRPHRPRAGSRMPLTLDDLIKAGEAIVIAALAAARMRHW